jgi:hypothetical protein
MTWQQTYSGTKFDLLNPQADLVDLQDICHALSQLCRFGGHTKYFYSVGEHCLRARLIVKDKDILTQLYVLMHDFTEAYVVDVPRSIKLMLKEYKPLEERVAVAIAEHFKIPWPMNQHYAGIVHECDEIMLATEARDALYGGPKNWIPTHKPLFQTISPMSMDLVKANLMVITTELLEKLKEDDKYT